MKRFYPALTICIALYCQAAGAASERLQLDKTTILGNRELPRVTFVVPWGDAAAKMPAWKPEPTARPATPPLDSGLYQRQVEFLKQINSGKGSAKAR
jgi:hypothetical protein